MCRLLYVKSNTTFDIPPHLKAFADIAKNSCEYQGHGWGLVSMDGADIKKYWSVKPIWEDELSQFKKSKVLYVHARSAFKNEGILKENNMPFLNKEDVFIFNGELHGVKIKAQGKIGAEKIFNYIKRFDKGDLFHAVKKAMPIISKQSKYVRAMNLIIGNQNRAVLCSVYNEDPKYFTMCKKNIGAMRLFCSEPYPNDSGWEKIQNNTIEEIL